MKYIIVIACIIFCSHAAHAQQQDFEILRQRAITYVEHKAAYEDESRTIQGKTVTNRVAKYTQNRYLVRVTRNTDGSVKLFSIRNTDTGFLILDGMKKGTDESSKGPAADMLVEFITAFLR